MINYLTHTQTWSEGINKDSNKNIILSAKQVAEWYVEHGTIFIVLKSMQSSNALFMDIYISNKSKKHKCAG